MNSLGATLLQDQKDQSASPAASLSSASKLNIPGTRMIPAMCIGPGLYIRVFIARTPLYLLGKAKTVWTRSCWLKTTFLLFANNPTHRVHGIILKGKTGQHTVSMHREFVKRLKRFTVYAFQDVVSSIYPLLAFEALTAFIPVIMYGDLRVRKCYKP